MRKPADRELGPAHNEPGEGSRKEFLDQAATVLEIIRGLTVELHPHSEAGLQVTPDSKLDSDLGLDSLGRVELLVRLERALGVTLPDHVLASADTPHDLIRAIGNSGEAAWQPLSEGEARGITLGEVQTRPESARTIVEALEWHVEAHPRRPHVNFYGESGEPEVLTYEGLLHGAKAVAAGLLEKDLQPGQAVAIMLPTGFEYFFSFFGILLAGGLPVPIYPPARPSQVEDHLRRHARILDNARTVIMITVREAKLVARLLKMQVPSLRHVATASELAREEAPFMRRAALPSEIALLQYTSGSTGAPKGVVLTHDNLITNIRIYGDSLGVLPSDIFVSWLPLYHDMGLIGAWLGSMYYGVPLILMSPLTFLARPERWLWAIHHHRGTVSAAPNFAYELCTHRIEAHKIEGLDLSSWRMAANGAEAVIPETLHAFNARFKPHGLRPEAITPVYGLAEATLGVSLSPVESHFQVDRVKREAFERNRVAEPAREDDATALQFVSCGRPMKGVELRVVNEAGQELAEREEGRLQFKSPSATSGYFRNPAETKLIQHGEWMDSGDLAYISGGELYLTGRRKDMIIRAGRNIYPPELEDAVGSLPGVRKGCVAVFGSSDPATGTERLVVLAESRERSSERKDELRRAISDAAMKLLGIAPDDVVVAPPYTVLKTSSGKLRRTACRELYEKGQIGARQRSVLRQMLRVWLAGIAPQFGRSARLAGELAYSAYWLTVLGLLIVPVSAAIALTPKPSWSWRILGASSRLLFRLTGTPLVVRGREHLPTGRPYLMALTHASYLDGLAAAAAFPQPMAIVAKRELAASPVFHTLLRRLGALFVERQEHERSAADSKAIATTAAQRSVLIFPEGTFVRAPGMLPFRMGGFLASVESGTPIVPVVMRGTRSILRDGQWLARRGVISVTVLPLIAPEGADWAAAVKLRDQVRAEMLRHYGEPDMVPSRG
ncbi:MAG: AMP-binding protein [SAR324 cluster bacterium]|nr:AMP-binding protein [SAR324 cluster bacterium]